MISTPLDGASLDDSFLDNSILDDTPLITLTSTTIHSLVKVDTTVFSTRDLCLKTRKAKGMSSPEIAPDQTAAGICEGEEQNVKRAPDGPSPYTGGGSPVDIQHAKR
ncbi:hypothetical protein PG993_010701 [Apiospora rasikravindrae]|uniref:Pheromone n=1 Tax=Apiospora rasikravindrae TaxID=990691 RepID=A0ABR1SC73_9PEZI